MIRNRHFPIFFILLGWLHSCTHSINPTDEKACTEYLSKGDAFYTTSNLDSALVYYFKASTLCHESKNERKAYLNFQIANVQQHFGDLYGSEETITNALADYKGKIYKPYLYNLLAVTYDKQKRYDEALKYYALAEETFTTSIEKANAKSNIGLVYLEKEAYATSIKILQSLLNNPTITESKTDYARIVDNLGYVQFKNKNPQALPNLTTAFEIRTELQDPIGLIASNMHLSDYYLGKDNEKSLQFAQDAYTFANKVNNPDDRLEALQFIIENSTPADAKKYFSTYLAINDSITSHRQSAKNQYAKLKFDQKTALKDVELQRNQKYIYLLLLIVISGIGAYVVSALRKKSSEKIKSISYETETRISKKIHDELANDVFNALTYAETQNLSDLNKKETLLVNLDQIYARTRNISRENSSIDTGEDYPKHLIHLLTQYDSNSVNVIIHKITSIDWSLIKKETKIALYRVLQELMVNMKKHSNCSVVVLRFEHQKSQIIIHYADNGKGTELLKSKKGLQNAENRIHVINGTITFESEPEKGFKATVVIPK